MADKHEIDDFDSILQSIDLPADGAEDDANLDELLKQLSIEFPADFGPQAASQKPGSALTHAENPAQEAVPDVLRVPTRGKNCPQPKAEPETPSGSHPKKQGGFLDFLSRHHKGINLGLVLAALLLIGGIAAILLTQGSSDPYGNRILENVRVAGVDVGGMSRQEAVAAVTAAVGNEYDASDMTVVLGSEELILAASQTLPTLNVAQAVENAYAYGRSGSTVQRQQEYREAQLSPVDIPLGNCLTLNESYIRTTISAFLSDFSVPSVYVPSGYTLEGVRPELDADSFDETAPCQDLVLTVGSPGGSIDMDGIISTIAEAYGQKNFRAVIPEAYLPKIPEPLDLDAIYQELHVDAVEASDRTGEWVSGSCGYTFPLEYARQQLSAAGYGNVITIPMEYIIPERLYGSGNFQYTLSSFSTPLSTNSAYNENMRLICQQLNGITLEAGETFKFNEALAERTEQNGFKSAPAHGDQCLEEEIGGGVDQVATTLYVASMTGGMKLVQRHNAAHACSYAANGTELSVSGWKDFKFRNPLDCSVMIRARVTDSQVIIRFLSEKEAEFEGKLEVRQVSTTPFSTVTVKKSAAEGYENQQELTEGIEGGQFSLTWILFRKGTEDVIEKTGEYISLPPLNRAIVALK